MKKESLMDRHAALVRVQVKGKRRCTKCGKKFISNSYGHRRCGQCDQAVEHWSDRVEILGA